MSQEYGAPLDLCRRLVKLGLHHRAVVLATGEADPGKAFIAAANALTRELPVRFRLESLS